MRPPALRPEAEGLARVLPPLLAEAERLAASVLGGGHGRARAGRGDEFWQFRPAAPGDGLRAIDWRRSARSEQAFVRETEWQVAQSVLLWVDPGRSMQFASRPAQVPKSHRARLLALALAILLLRGGERVGLLAPDLPARSGQAQREALAAAFDEMAPEGDYAAPPTDAAMPKAGRMVLFSDFFADPAALSQLLARAAGGGTRGVLMQVLDPAEGSFPFRGRTLFQSMSGQLRHDSAEAAELRADYLGRLAARQAELTSLAEAAGWRFHCHLCDSPPAPALLWLSQALAERERGL